MPKFRTIDYAIWGACERFNILPPDCKSSWNECSNWAKANLLAYHQLRDYEKGEEG